MVRLYNKYTLYIKHTNSVIHDYFILFHFRDVCGLLPYNSGKELKPPCLSRHCHAETNPMTENFDEVMKARLKRNFIV